MTKIEELFSLVVDSLKDESGASNKYISMMELVSESDIPDSDKALILGLIFKINNDEETHKVLLEIIRDVVEVYKVGA